MQRTIQGLCAALCSVASFFFGAADQLLLALLGMMALDYLTGILCAFQQKKLSSRVGFRGLTRKLLILLLVSMGHLLDAYVLGGGSLLRGAVAGFYLANEGLSILENAGTLGLPLPDKLVSALQQLCQDSQSEDS